MNESSLFWFVEIIAIIIVVYLCRHSQPPYSRDTMWTTRTVRWEMKINRNVRCEIWRIEKEKKKMMIESRKKTRSTYKVQSRCWWWSKAKMIYFPPLVDKTFSAARPVCSRFSFTHHRSSFTLPLCHRTLLPPSIFQQQVSNGMKNCFGMKLLFMGDEMIYLNGFSWDSSMLFSNNSQLSWMLWTN